VLVRLATRAQTCGHEVTAIGCGRVAAARGVAALARAKRPFRRGKGARDLCARSRDDRSGPLCRARQTRMARLPRPLLRHHDHRARAAFPVPRPNSRPLFGRHGCAISTASFSIASPTSAGEGDIHCNTAIAVISSTRDNGDCTRTAGDHFLCDSRPRASSALSWGSLWCPRSGLTDVWILLVSPPCVSTLLFAALRRQASSVATLVLLSASDFVPLRHAPNPVKKRRLE